MFPGDDDSHGEVADGVHLVVDGVVLGAHRVPPVLHLLDELLVEAEGVMLVLHDQRLQHEPQGLPYQLQVLDIWRQGRCSEFRSGLADLHGSSSRGFFFVFREFLLPRK